MYALVEIKGKQYKAVQGKTIQVDLFEEPVGEQIVCDKVLLLSDGSRSAVGRPYLENASVSFSLEDEAKGKKIRVYKYKKRKKYRLTQGHRQQYSLLRVQEIQGAL